MTLQMPDPSTPAERLDSWKAIAQYLQRDVATVRRWEKTSGLPVHRVPGGSSRAVFAYVSEIEAWLNAGGTALGRQADAPSADAENPTVTESNPPPRDRTRVWSGIAAVLVVTALAITGAWRLRAGPGAIDVRVDVTEEAATARDSTGTLLWRHVFPPEYITAFSGYGKRSEVVGGANPAVFVATGFQVRQSDRLTEGGELIQLSPSGVVQRRFQFDDHATFDGKAYGSPWGITTFAVDDSTGSRRIAVAAHHYEWSASMVTILDDRFRRVGTYWQWGWIEFVHWLGPDRLLIGGFNDARDGGMVALLDPSALDGQSPESPGTHGYCQTCGRTAPLRMAVMPRTELNRVTASRFNRAVIELLPDRIVARTIEVLPEGGVAVDALYEFSRGLDLLDASLSGPYWEMHEALHKQGKLSHDREHCPARNGPGDILVWDAREGWRSRHIR